MRLLLLVVLLAAPAAAYGEGEAAATWQEQQGTDWVEAVGHAPEAVPAGSQFSGWIRFRPDVDVQDVRYQVCIVADRCIISPRPATHEGNGTWGFDTADFRLPPGLGGGMYRWEGGDWIGIQWFVHDGEDLLPFPRPLEGPACDADPVGCQETHYFTFHIEPEAADAPAVPVTAVVALLALTLLWGGRRA